MKEDNLVGGFGVWGANYNPQKIEPIIYASLIIILHSILIFLQALVFAILMIIDGLLIWWSSRDYDPKKELQEKVERGQNKETSANFRNPAYEPSSFDNDYL